ncbi:MAG: restriction endonuclease, partial [Bacteroidota bacterium]
AFVFVSEKIVFSDATIVFVFDSYSDFSILQASINESWAWKYSSTMKGDRRYSPSDAFENYPFPELDEQSSQLLEAIGETYYQLRQELMTKIQLGLTKTYNQFHNQQLQPINEEMSKAAVEKQYGKATWQLYKHLAVDEKGEVSFNEAVSLIEKLRILHKEMDEAVLAAYGWHEETAQWGPAIDLAHDFYEVDYLPDNDNVRYTISPEARREVLKRLLLLNHERYEAEIRQGLHKEKEVRAFYEQKGQEVPEEVLAFYTKQKAKPPAKKRKPKTAPAPELFAVEATAPKREEVSLHARVVLREVASGKEDKVVIVADVKNAQLVMGHRPIALSSQLSMAMLNRKAGAKFDCDGKAYEIVEIS